MNQAAIQWLAVHPARPSDFGHPLVRQASSGAIVGGALGVFDAGQGAAARACALACYEGRHLADDALSNGELADRVVGPLSFGLSAANECIQYCGDLNLTNAQNAARVITAGGVEGISVVTWTAAGAAIGTALIPIPVVGTVIGGFLGGLFGGWFGHQLTDNIVHSEPLVYGRP